MTNKNIQKTIKSNGLENISKDAEYKIRQFKIDVMLKRNKIMYKEALVELIVPDFQNILHYASG